MNKPTNSVNIVIDFKEANQTMAQIINCVATKLNKELSSLKYRVGKNRIQTLRIDAGKQFVMYSMMRTARKKTVPSIPVNPAYKEAEEEDVN